MGKGGVGLQASVCLEEFENYLMMKGILNYIVLLRLSIFQ